MKDSSTYRDEFIHHVQRNEGILFKILSLYTDFPEDREDLKQEILLQAWKSYPNFAQKSKFSTWLYKVALNTSLNFIKKNQKGTEALEDHLEVEHTNQSGSDSELLYLIIKGFNEVDRMLITLHLEGFKNLEIAEMTGMTSNHVNVKLHRLKNLIIEKFKKLNYA